MAMCGRINAPGIFCPYVRSSNIPHTTFTYTKWNHIKLRIIWNWTCTVKIFLGFHVERLPHYLAQQKISSWSCQPHDDTHIKFIYEFFWQLNILLQFKVHPQNEMMTISFELDDKHSHRNPLPSADAESNWKSLKKKISL